MAYFQNKKKEGQLNAPGGSFQGSGIGAGAGNAAGRQIGGQAVPGAPDKGGFVNLSTYLGLNQEKGNEMADKLSGGITGKMNKLGGQLEKHEQTFDQGLNTAATGGKGGFGTKDAMTASPYGSVQDVPGWQSTKDALDETAGKAKQLAGGFNQRQGLVNETYGRGAPTYSTGMGLYDNALASHYGGQQFGQAGTLAEYLTGKANTAAVGSVAQASQQNQAAAGYNANLNASLKQSGVEGSAKASRQAQVQAAADRAGVPLDAYLQNNPGAQTYINSGDESGWSGTGTLRTVGR